MRPKRQPAGLATRRALLLMGRHQTSHPGNRMKAMTTNPQVETVSSGADKAKLAAAALLVVGAVVAFYLLGTQDCGCAWSR